MRYLHCTALYGETGWVESAYIGIDDNGLIASISEKKPPAGAAFEELGGYVVPGFPNAHSHSFQYAMGGLTEHLPSEAKADDFWSWRELMYGLAGRVNPDQVESIASMAYAEMLRFGYTSVAEFHYLHHDAGGRPYANQAELGRRLMAAAATAGIHLTLVPILYSQGGFKKKATPGQARFLSKSVEAYVSLVDATRAAAKGRSDVLVGHGVHSLRAAPPEDIKDLFELKMPGPMHLHVAEQRREVEECLTHLGKRPLEWLLENVALGRGTSLVHATHAVTAELKALVQTDATVVVCPSTEGNLGDGFFPMKEFVALGGEVAIGSDSHIGLNPLEELRWFDYGQRLKEEKRNSLCQRGGDDSGRIICDMAWKRGRAALGFKAGAAFAVGNPFDALVLDPNHPVLCQRPAERRLAALVYAGDASCLVGTLRRGEWIVKEQKHRRSEELRTAYRKALASLTS